MIYFTIALVAFLNIFALCEYFNIQKYYKELKHRDFLLSDALIVLGTIPMIPMLLLLSMIIGGASIIGWFVDAFFKLGSVVLFKRK